MKRLGQHFLKNKSAVDLIVHTLEAKPEETIIEIGPGHGELTDVLQIENRKSKIILIEKDSSLCTFLKKRFSANDQITIREGDALEILPSLITQLPNYPITNYNLVGNIPYYITGHLLRVVSELVYKPGRCIFMLQREVAERIIAIPPKANRLSASVGYWAEPKIVKVLHPSDFSPAPKVDSAIITLEKKPLPAYADENRYYAALRAVFAQPRKTILNNLAEARVSGIGYRVSDGKQKVADMLRAIGLDPEARPQNMSIEDVAKIAESLF